MLKYDLVSIPSSEPLEINILCTVKKPLPYSVFLESRLFSKN